MANFPFVIGDALQIGTATITATGNAVVLPTGTQVGSTAVATSTEVATGGGPKITNLQVIDNSFQVLDDTAVDITGGYIKITGTNFTSGCIVYIGLVPATATSFVSATEVRAQLAATAAGTYPVYLVNPDGGVAIRVPGVTFSASPSWQTASALSDQYDGAPLTLALVASDATSYTLVSGALPPGLSLNTSTGAITGTITGVTVDTVYTFTVRATDAQNQDSPRTFTVNVAVSDTYFRLTTLLLSGSAIPANTVIRDSSTNNFNLTVFGDARASNFTPYGTGWSILTRDRSYITIPASSDFDIINTDFTIEFWFNPNAFNTMSYSGSNFFGTGLATAVNGWSMGWSGSGTTVTAIEFRVFASQAQSANSFTGLTVNFGTWYHIALQRNGASAGNLRLFVNGVLQGSAQTANTYSIAGGNFVLGSGSYLENGTYSGNADYYISNIRLTKSAVYDITGFTPPTSNLTQLTNTTLLIGQSNRLINNGTNTGAITSSGHTSTRVQLNSFNPFNITNTGVNGSMYFDGSGDYLTVPSNAVFAFGTGDFTIEFWLYPTTVATTQRNITFPTTNAPIVYINGSRQLVLENYGIAAIATTTNTVDLNAWNHCVATRQSGTLKLFINGVQGVSVANSTNWVQSAVNIGTDAGTNFTNGYITDVRILKGTGYSTITVPTSPLTAITNTQLLTLQYDQPHNNHTFLDSSSNQFLITRSGNATQGTFSPFSPAGWSNYFSGPTPATSYFTLSSNVLSAVDVTTGLDTTYEFWVYPTSVTAVQANGHNESSIWSKGTIYAACIINSSGIIRHYTYTGAENYTSTPANSAPLNTWTHVAVVLTNNTVKIFINGQLSVTGTRYAAQLTGQAFKIGAGNVSGSYPSTFFGGYISNFRIVTSALYSANFSPATTSLTAVPNTSLLICQNNRFVDNSTNAFAITASGSPQVQAFSPFAPTAVYSPAVHGGSAYFDGSGDYARIGSDITPLSFLNTAGAVATIEAWVYATSLRSGTQSYTHPCILGIGSTYMNFGVANGTPRFYWWNGAAGTTLDSSITITANTWNHIAVVFSGTGSNNYKIFVNGALGGTGTFTNIGWASASGGNNVLVGREEANPATSDWPGYISGLRIINGSALYNSSFTPATTPFTSTANTICLLNFTDAAILDSTGRNVLETVADAKSSSVITKFTGGSMWFDGTGDRLATVFSPLQDLSLGNWTIEFWLNLGATIPTTYRSICGASNGGGGLPKWVMIMNANTGYTYQANRLMFATYNGADRQINVAVTWASNTWYHIAVVHNNGTTALYLDGSSQGTIAFNIASGITGAIRIGADGEGYSDFTGYISDLRITRGQARYTANFTAPTAPARLK